MSIDYAGKLSSVWILLLLISTGTPIADASRGGGSWGSGITSFLTSTGGNRNTHSTRSFRTIQNKAIVSTLPVRGGSTVTTASTTTVSATASSSLAIPLNETAASNLSYNASAVDPGSMTIPQLWDSLQSSPEGLSSSDARARIQQYGKNALESPPGKSVWKLIAEQFEDRLVQILLGVAVLSGVFSYLEVRQHSGMAGGDALWKSFVEPFVILAILVLNAAVGVWQSQSAQGSLDALQKMQPTLATVLRDGAWLSGLDAAELVPGDVMEIRVGDKVPADSRLLKLQSSSMQIDEGSLTGESVTVGKLPGEEGTRQTAFLPIQYQKGMLYSGTMVTSGTGKAIVVQTGMTTQMGKV